MKILILDYGVGNLHSIKNILKRIGIESIISGEIEDILKSEKMILPGVGSFDTAIRKLQEKKLIDPLNEKVLNHKIPVLGICLGMQLMTNGSEEGKLPGLGWIDADTCKFRFEDRKLKVPHMGWNIVKNGINNRINSNFIDEMRFYFVHSYYVKCKKNENVLFETDYGIEFDSGIVKDNIFGVQFHPEKSHKFGMKLLKNFAEL